MGRGGGAISASANAQGTRMDCVARGQGKTRRPEIRRERKSMMAASPFVLARDLWVLFGVYWLVAALKRKQTKKRESSGQRLAYVVPLILAFILLAEPWMSRGWLGARLFPCSETAAWIGLALVAAGVALAFWARWHLGANWSGSVTLKEGHELIRTGPYRAIRHPIYTAILLAIAGSAGRAGMGGGVEFVLREGAAGRGFPETGIRRRL